MATVEHDSARNAETLQEERFDINAVAKGMPQSMR